jgi:hypothetical protein
MPTERIRAPGEDAHRNRAKRPGFASYRSVNRRAFASLDFFPERVGIGLIRQISIRPIRPTRGIDMTEASARSRRRFLLSTAAVLGTATIPIVGVGCTSTPKTNATAVGIVPASFNAFQRQLEGPIYSNPCPFTADLKLDDEGQRQGIDRH